MYSESPKKMQQQAKPLLLKQPIAQPKARSSVATELRNGPLPTGLTKEEVDRLFDEVTKMVYGTRQGA